MDFGKLLHKAQKNEITKKEPIKYYSTKFEPPKKEQRNKTKLSVNIKKFLEKKEEEEKQKRLEAQKKKEELLALRAKDKKAVKRVNVMLKRTKSANQSVIEDAVDTDNTAVTLAGPAQPDEDDYGYVSQEASAYYNKMMEKYSKIPDQPKFTLEKKKVSTNLNSTKDRVKAALEKEKEEAMMPHKRKRKSNTSDQVDTTEYSEKKTENFEEEKLEPKKLKTDKPRPKMPPPLNFAELMKLAEKKQFEPIIIEKKPKEEENPLTKKQKREMERMREWQERKNEKNKPSHNGSSKPTSGNKEKGTSKAGNEKIPKLGSSKLEEALRKDDKKSTPVNIEQLEESPEPEKKKIDWGPKHPSWGKQKAGNTPSQSGSTSSNHKSNDLKNKLDNCQKQEPQRSISNQPQKSLSSNSYSNRSVSSECKKLQPDAKQASSDRQKENKYNSIERREVNGNKLLTKSRQLPPSTSKPKQFPPTDLKPKQFPPSDLRPKQFPPADVKRKNTGKMQVNKRRIMDDDDEDEDSEMDDFIDDGPEEEEDYSKYIKEIFGYNKSKYVEYDDGDDDIMESSFAQQMKEECISTKIGIMEDLEDIKLEEEHKRKKALMKKKLGRSK